MATRFDPFQDMDRLVGEMFGSARAAATIPMDFFRSTQTTEHPAEPSSR